MSGNDDANAKMKEFFKPISLLEYIKRNGKPWEELAPKNGVTNPDPPWKVNLEATCDLLAGDSSVKHYYELVPGSCVLPSLERRYEEDELSATLYEDVPYPERVLLSLAHSMIRRGLIDEKELAARMEEVRKRLTSV
jgi:hypothetical protein